MGLLEVKDRVQRLLADLVGTVEIDREGDFMFSYESTRVFVTVSEWSETDLTTVSVLSIPLFEVPGSSELFERIATDARSMRFGTLSLFKREDGAYNVNFHHTLVGDTLDPDELKHAVSAVAYTADHIDDELQKEFGGKRWADLG
jgi:hypothetical protein